MSKSIKGSEPCSDVITLYDMNLSPFCEIVRLAMCEKGLPCKIKNVNPMNCDQLEPSFARLNPAMKVPTLTIGEEPDVAVHCDSYKILKFLEEEYKCGKSLVIESKKSEIWAFVDKVYDINFGVFMFSAFKKLGIAGMMKKNFIDKPLVILKKKMEENPDLKEVYEKKIKEVEGRQQAMGSTKDPLPEEKAKTQAFLDQVEKTLEASNGDFLFGSYSIADVALTLLLAKLSLSAHADMFCNSSHPKLKQYWQTVFKRASFKQAAVNYTVPMMIKVVSIPIRMTNMVSSAMSAVGSLFFGKKKEAAPADSS